MTATPMSAVRIGMPAAISDLNVSTRIRKETRSPSSSGTLLGSELLL